MISGDKKYIWIVNEDKVYDIEDNLATCFFWPGDKFNLGYCDYMDIFNVTQDKSLMST